MKENKILLKKKLTLKDKKSHSKKKKLIFKNGKNLIKIKKITNKKTIEKIMMLKRFINLLNRNQL